MENGDRKKCLYYLKEALKINKIIGNRLWQAYNEDAIGYVNDAIGNKELALKSFNRSADILRELDEKVKLSSTLNNIGWSFLAIKDFKQARSNIYESIELAKETNFLNGMWAGYESLTSLDTTLKNWQSAFGNQKLMFYYRDSLLKKEDLKKTLQLAMQFDFNRKQLEDSLKFAQEKEIDNIKLQRQKTYSYVVLFGLFVTGVLLFFAFKNYQKQRVANQKLHEAQEQLVRSEKLAAFGLMASRVAHEIQNPLNFVNNFSEISKELANEMVASNSEVERNEVAEMLIDNLRRISEHGKRASDIVRQLQEHTLKGTVHEFFEDNKSSS